MAVSSNGTVRHWRSVNGDFSDAQLNINNETLLSVQIDEPAIQSQSLPLFVFYFPKSTLNSVHNHNSTTIFITLKFICFDTTTQDCSLLLVNQNQKSQITSVNIFFNYSDSSARVLLTTTVGSVYNLVDNGQSASSRLECTLVSFIAL